MSGLLGDLNDEQRSAVEYIDGPLFVFAGPGTGKTNVTTRKLAYLVKEKGFRPEEVLALTFSQKAAEDMEGRARDLLPGVAGVRISTFHSFCNEVIGENALEMGIDANSGVFTEEYQQAFLLENLDGLGLEALPVPNRPIELATTFQGAIARFKQENISIERLESYLEMKKADKSEKMGNLRDLAKAYRAYEDFKKSRGFLDFGDMQLLALELFEKKPETLKRYQDRFRYVIVDEFQDTDFIQLRIVFKLAPAGNLTVVGDDDQSIYRFRGAYLTNVRELDEHYRSLGMTPLRKVLDMNYRCTPDIQAVATGLIQNNPDREKKKMETKKKSGDPVVITRFKDDSDQALGILARVRELHEKGRPYDEMAVLVRRRVDARPVQEAFENAGIPFEIIGSREFFGEAVVRAVVAYLRVLEDPQKNQPSLGMILQRPAHGILPGEVQKLGRHARDRRLSLWEALGDLRDFKGEKQQLQRFRGEMDGLFRVKGEKGLYELVRTIVMGRDFLKTEVASRNLANVRLLNRFLEISARFVEIYPDSNLEDFILHLRAFADLGLQDELRAPSAGKLHLLTVHGSKGMEFPIVIIPCLSRDRFPSRWKDYKITVPDELADGVAPEGTPEEVHLQEERRLLYVGITRAKEKLFLDCAARYGTNVRETPPSQFLEEVRKAGKGYEERNVMEALESPYMASAGIEEALHGRLLSSIARGDHQEAIKAVAALAKKGGADISALSVPRHLDLDGYARELELVARAPEVEHARKAEYSPSKLSQYEKCPKSYFFQYVMEIPGEVKTFFELGTLAHAVIEAITRQLKDGKTVSEKEALALLDRMWKPSVYESKEKEKKDRSEAEDMVKKFLAHQAGKKGTILEIEKFVEMDIEGRKMRGRVDRIDDMGDSLQVIDYKSSRNRTSKPELKKDLQMGIYKSAVEAMTGRPVASVGHWYLRMDQEWMIELGEGELEEIKKRALGIIKKIEKGEFAPTPGYGECMYCDFRELCEEG